MERATDIHENRHEDHQLLRFNSDDNREVARSKRENPEALISSKGTMTTAPRANHNYRTRRFSESKNYHPRLQNAYEARYPLEDNAWSPWALPRTRGEAMNRDSHKPDRRFSAEAALGGAKTGTTSTTTSPSSTKLEEEEVGKDETAHFSTTEEKKLTNRYDATGAFFSNGTELDIHQDIDREVKTTPLSPMINEDNSNADNQYREEVRDFSCNQQNQICELIPPVTTVQDCDRANAPASLPLTSPLLPNMNEDSNVVTRFPKEVLVEDSPFPVMSSEPKMNLPRTSKGEIVIDDSVRQLQEALCKSWDEESALLKKQMDLVSLRETLKMEIEKLERERIMANLEKQKQLIDERRNAWFIL